MSFTEWSSRIYHLQRTDLYGSKENPTVSCNAIECCTPVTGGGNRVVGTDSKLRCLNTDRKTCVPLCRIYNNAVHSQC